MSVASSTTPVMDWNSCSTPSMRTAVTAAPSMDESRVRRRAFPMVVPKPRSNGCAENLPYLSVSVSVSTARRLGFWNPLQSMDDLLYPSWPRSILRTGGWFGCGLGCGVACVSITQRRISRVLRCATECQRLLAVKLDDELLVDRQVHVFALRQGENLAGEIVAVDVQPLNRVLRAGKVLRLFEDGERLRAFANRNLVADLALERRDVDLAAIYLNVAVANKLPRLAAADGEAEAVADVVQAGLKLLQQKLAGHAGAVGGLLVVGAELGLEREVDALGLLLLAQLEAVADDLFLLLGLAMLAGRKVALLHGA